MRTFLFCLVSSLYCLPTHGQLTANVQGQVRLLADLNLNPRRVQSGLSHFRVAASVAPVIYFGKNRHVFFTPLTSFNFMVGRGLGASMRDKRGKIRLQGTVSTVIGAQYGPSDWAHQVQVMPHFYQPGFWADKRNVLALASNFIMVDKNGSFIRAQRVGSMFVGLGRIEVMYANDGPFFSKWAGDGKDRYWTGSMSVGYLVKTHWWEGNRTTAIRWSYDRYTSYATDLYELATALKMSYVPYSNFSNLYNRGSMRWGVFSNDSPHNFSAEFAINDDDDLDVQNWLHRWFGYAWHRTVNRSNCSFQFSYSNLQSQTTRQ